MTRLFQKTKRLLLGVTVRLYVLYERRTIPPGSLREYIPPPLGTVLRHNPAVKKNIQIIQRALALPEKSTFFPDIPYRKIETARERGRFFFAYIGEKRYFLSNFRKKVSLTAAHDVCCPPIRAPPRCCFHSYFKFKSQMR